MTTIWRSAYPEGPVCCPPTLEKGPGGAWAYPEFGAQRLANGHKYAFGGPSQRTQAPSHRRSRTRDFSEHGQLAEEVVGVQGERVPVLIGARKHVTCI